MLRIVDISQAGQFITRKAVRLAEAEKMVAPILEDVEKRGDEALLEYARKFDSLNASTVRVSDAELAGAEGDVVPEFRVALETADANIRE